jgi:hypothetical protein
VALRNAQHLIREKVDLVIEFQTERYGSGLVRLALS